MVPLLLQGEELELILEDEEQMHGSQSHQHTSQLNHLQLKDNIDFQNIDKL